jgi:alpha,alpha-trehalase
MINEIPDTYRSVVNAILQPKQWDYPNIWPPTEYLAVIGLLKYGYVLEAKRVMQRSLRGQAKVFRKYKTFFEKIDGSRGDIAANYHYINQSGFGWTNAVFYRYVQILDKMEKDGEDSIYGFPMPDKPPFTLSILH